MKNLTEEQENQIGEEIIELLYLKIKKNGRVNTDFGDKTPLGLARTIFSIIGRFDTEKNDLTTRESKFLK